MFFYFVLVVGGGGDGQSVLRYNKHLKILSNFWNILYMVDKKDDRELKKGNND